MPDPVLEYQSPQDASLRPHNTAATASVVFAAMLPFAVAMFVLTSRAIGACMIIPALIAPFAAIAFGVVGRRRAEECDGVGRVRATWGIAVGSAGIVVAVGALMLSVWTLGRTYERMDRITCISNMRNIYYAAQLFAQDRGNVMPRKLGELLEHLDASAFVCNSSRDERAPGPTTKEVAAQLEMPKHSSYVYLGAGKTWPVAADVVLAYEDRENHDGDGIHVLFGDGSVKWYSAKEAEQLLGNIKPPTTTPMQ